MTHIAWLTGLGTLGGITAGTARYMFPNILYEPPKSYKIGRPQDYPEGVNFLSDRKIFLVRQGSLYKVISAVCTHLGCTPRWEETKNQWECPCHGTIFNDKGIKVSGPAPKPLPWYDIAQGTDGRLIVDEKRIVPFAQTLLIEA